MNARTVTLEMLRHGPSTNQLLSPLTPYLALCGNHDAETVHVGFEHVSMLRRMRGLRYQDGPSAGHGAIEEASSEVSKLVASIRSLTAEVSSVPRGEGEVIHLRLVLSAAELALLPFELVKSPAGFPGHGQWLSLQTTAPIALTREVRRVSSTTVHWPERPRILMIAASPLGVAPVPLRAHLLALRGALDPWLARATTAELATYLTVIPRATPAAVRDACARAAGEGKPFTHVHILAHGAAGQAHVQGEQSYGLAFHSDADPAKMDVVSGTRLAAALRCHPAGATGPLSAPAVVTVASCDSANVGDVITSGASLAHSLHEAGVPLVLASQYPLSVRGSAIMAEVVYTRLLRGEDPRALVHDLRQALHVGCPDTHDWASVVVYASFPPDIDAQVRSARRRCVVTKAESAIRRAEQRDDAKPADFDAALAELEGLLPKRGERMTRSEAARVRGVVAHMHKRVAEARFAPAAGEVSDWPEVPPDLTVFSHVPAPTPVEGVSLYRDAPAPRRVPRPAAERALLERAREHYLALIRGGSAEAWPLVQHLALGVALDAFDGEAGARQLAGAWCAAHFTAEDNLRVGTGRQIAWAHAALAELFVIAALLPEGHWARAESEAGAARHVQAVLTDAGSFDKYSLLRQLRRYATWWWQGRPDLARLPGALCQRMRDAGVGETH